MTLKEEKILRKLLVESVFEGVTRAMHSMKLTTYTPSPMSQDHKIQGSSYQVFEDLWPETIDRKEGSVQGSGSPRQPT